MAAVAYTITPDPTSSISTIGDDSSALTMNGSDSLVVQPNAHLRTDGYRSFAVYISTSPTDATPTKLTIDGEVKGAKDAAIVSRDMSDITIGTAGRVVSFGNTSSGMYSAVNLAGESKITNEGYISSAGTHKAIGFWLAKPDNKLELINTGTIEKISADDDIVIAGDSNADIVTNSGTITGAIGFYSGNDIYHGESGTISGTIFLGTGNDTAYGGAGTEVIYAHAGDDLIDGGGGVDTICFSDVATVDLRITGPQMIGVSEGKDTILNIENVRGSDESDIITGNDGANVLEGAGGSDRLSGAGDNDTLWGGAGDDTLDGGEGANKAGFSGAKASYTIIKNADGSVTVTDNRSGHDGIDVLKNIRYAQFDDTTVDLNVIGNVPPASEPKSLLLIGTAGRDALMGEAGNDIIKGLAGIDTLKGEAGNDKIYGGLGNDLLTGGANQDIFVFDTKLGRTNAANKKVNLDKITDFSVKDDTIHLAKGVFSKIAKKGYLAKGAFFSGTKAHDADDRVIHNKKTGALLYDADGTGAKEAIQFATLARNLKITEKDFYVI
ncbi:calcium-binding protein [Microvirga rosea]|uniref:calcium-binding protein n=1 Tax=Microvirga rosea TaxID=2715425 RepID=UPI001D0B33FD|nr:calcium-binding protein [Microvirga rosea]MCB8820870.1 calcium-binding protein [Microvirga rosea]